MIAHLPEVFDAGGGSCPLWADLHALELLTHYRKNTRTHEHCHGPSRPRAHL